MAAAAVNNKIYVVGGQTPLSTGTLEVYDPATDTWATKVAMPTPRYRLAAAATGNTIFAIGGLGVSDSATVEEYDASKDP